MASSRKPRDIVSTVRAFARRHGIFRPGPVVLAVSGGTDSTALALIMAELRGEFGLVLHVAHFDHRTRPRSAPRDAAFVADIADHIAAPIRVGRAARPPKSEDDARRDRYEFLRRVAAEIGATAIVTGHTQDDQAETVLLHLTRGAGIGGAAAMRPLRDGVARPLLVIGRAETAAICRTARVLPREDPSNRSVRFARNRVRRNVIPELAKINPQVNAALARFAEAAGAAQEATTDLPPGGETKVDIRSLPSNQARRAARLAASWQAATGRVLGHRQRLALVELTRSHRGTNFLDLPGGAAIREYSTLFLAAARADSGLPSLGDSISTPAVRLEYGKEVIWRGWRISLGLDDIDAMFKAVVDGGTAAVLFVRSRRAGDRVSATRKLQDAFVDSKVPARARSNWPILVSGDRILWVPGVTPPPRGNGSTLCVSRSAKR